MKPTKYYVRRVGPSFHLIVTTEEEEKIWLFLTKISLFFKLFSILGLPACIFFLYALTPPSNTLYQPPFLALKHFPVVLYFAVFNNNLICIVSALYNKMHLVTFPVYTIWQMLVKEILQTVLVRKQKK